MATIMCVCVCVCVCVYIADEFYIAVGLNLSSFIIEYDLTHTNHETVIYELTKVK